MKIAVDFKFPVTRLEILVTGSFEEVMARRRQDHPSRGLGMDHLVKAATQGNKVGVPSIGLIIRDCF